MPGFTTRWDVVMEMRELFHPGVINPAPVPATYAVGGGRRFDTARWLPQTSLWSDFRACGGEGSQAGPSRGGRLMGLALARRDRAEDEREF